MSERPSVTYSGKTVLHNTARWVVKTNRHTSTAGNDWGWIDGAPSNLCWSNDNTTFNYKAACEIARLHNQWLDEQKPLSIRLIEANEILDVARMALDKARAELADAESKYAIANEAVLELEAKREKIAA